MEKELILLSKLQFFNEKYNKQMFAIFKLCSEMKNYVTTFYAKNQRNFIEMKNGDKYIETSFNFNGIMFFIRLWHFCGNSKKDVPLYTIYNNDYNRFYINVEVSNHTIKKDFMDKMRKALEQKYLYYTYVKFCSLFNDDERNELNRKMTEIPKPSYALDDMATNEEDFKESIAQSLEELGKDLAFSSLRGLYYTLKKSKFRYRLSLDDVVHPMFSSYFSQRSLILKYCV